MGRETSSSAEAGGRRRSRVMGVLVVGLVVATALFGWMSVRTFMTFRDYVAETLPGDGTHLWPAGASVEQCIDTAYGWGVACKGMPTLCKGHAQKLMVDCFDDGDRAAYCAEIRTQTGTTGFGYAQCEARLALNTGPSGSRWAAEKLCAGLYRLATERCR